MARASTITADDLQITIHGDLSGQHLHPGNVDVEVVGPDGRRWGATFFTMQSIRALLDKNAVTGECGGGTYVWASDMIVVRVLSREAIEATVRDLQYTGEFERAFGPLDTE